MDLAKYIDYTLLKATGREEDIRRMCQEAKENGFKALCVHPYFVSLCSRLLKGTDVQVATVVGFPFGADKPAVKIFATQQAVADGATEIDMVINIAEMLSGNKQLVHDEIAAVVDAAGASQVKVIIETAYLNQEQIVEASKIVKSAGAHFVKTSTGFAPTGAKVEDIKLIRQTVGSDFGIKAAGGIGSYQVAVQMVEAGATRLGASKALDLVDKT